MYSARFRKPFRDRVGRLGLSADLLLGNLPLSFSIALPKRYEAEAKRYLSKYVTFGGTDTGAPPPPPGEAMLSAQGEASAGGSWGDVAKTAAVQTWEAVKDGEVTEDEAWGLAATAGAAVGGAVGSMFGPIGTALGSAIGTAVVYIARGIRELAEKFGEWIENVFAGTKRIPFVWVNDEGARVLRRKGWKPTPYGFEKDPRIASMPFGPRGRQISLGTFLWMIRRVQELGGGVRELARVMALLGMKTANEPGKLTDTSRAAFSASFWGRMTPRMRSIMQKMPASQIAEAMFVLHGLGWDLPSIEKHLFGKVRSGTSKSFAALQKMIAGWERDAGRENPKVNMVVADAAKTASAYRNVKKGGAGGKRLLKSIVKAGRRGDPRALDAMRRLADARAADKLASAAAAGDPKATQKIAEAARAAEAGDPQAAEALALIVNVQIDIEASAEASIELDEADGYCEGASPWDTDPTEGFDDAIDDLAAWDFDDVDAYDEGFTDNELAVAAIKSEDLLPELDPWETFGAEIGDPLPIFRQVLAKSPQARRFSRASRRRMLMA